MDILQDLIKSRKGRVKTINYILNERIILENTQKDIELFDSIKKQVK